MGWPRFPISRRRIDPSTVRVTAPASSRTSSRFPVRPGIDRVTLKLGAAGAIGRFRLQRLGPAGGERPGRGLGGESVYRPSVPDGNPRPVGGPTSLIHFDSGPIRTGADGSFQTPPQLMTGWTYQIVIRPEGDPPVNSDSLTAKTELTTVPPLRLRQAASSSGLVHRPPGSDRSPVRGSFSPRSRPTTTTDAQGRFVLEGILPDRTYLLVQAEGFRFQGWPAIPARQPQERNLTLVRTSEPPDRSMAPLPAPISLEESRALARRVLEPYLRAALEKGDD